MRNYSFGTSIIILKWTLDIVVNVKYYQMQKKSVFYKLLWICNMNRNKRQK